MLTSRWINCINQIFYDWQSLFLQVYQSTVKHSTLSHIPRKKIPNKSNSLTLHLKYSLLTVFTETWCFLDIFFIKRWHNTHLLPCGTIFLPSPAFGLQLLTSMGSSVALFHQTQHSMTGHLFCKCENDFEQKMEWREIEAQVNPNTKQTFLTDFFNTYYKKEKWRFRSRHCQQTTGSPKATVCDGNFKKICQRH